MLVREFSIEEFKGIRKCKEPIKLSKFNVLVGRNNSGKTAILEALSLFPLPDHPIIPYGRRIDFLAKMHGGVSSLVYGYHGIARIKYVLEGKHEILVELSHTGGSKVFVNGMLFKGEVAELAKILGVRPSFEEIGKITFFIPNNTNALASIYQILKEEVFRNMLMKSGAHIRVVRDLVNKCVDDIYTEILLDSPMLRVRKELPGDGVFYIKIEDLGDGIERVILISLWLEALKPKLVLWDDFEASLHPTLIRELLRWLDEKGWQVVLATHSIDVLQRLVEVEPEDVKVILLCKTADDILRVQYLLLDELEDFLYSGQDPRYLVEVLKL